MVDRLVGKKVIGVKQTTKAIKSGEGKTVYLAKNADMDIIQLIEGLCKENSINIVYVESMKELGRLCGIDVGAATALVYKDEL